MNSLSSSQREKIKSFFKKKLNRDLSDSEIGEIQVSLFFLARAIHRYQLIQKGLISLNKNGNVTEKAVRDASPRLR